jgi:hypothetical protein
MRALVDEMNFCLDQVSTYYPLLHSNSLFVHLFLFFGGALTFQKVDPTYTWVVL